MVTRLIKEMFILGLAFFAAVYLMFPTLGIFELIPDAIPIIGSLDEGAATLILLNTLNYYGFNITNLYGKPTKQRRRRRRKLPPSDIITMPADDDQAQR
jgi:uncharacterized membrane protein YkvA (DUF1232 family)